MENISEYYFEQLKSSQTPGVVLLKFYRELLSKEVTKADAIMINKLIKVFGRFTTFFAILELVNIKDVTDTPYPLLFRICKNALERSGSDYLTSSSFVNLDRVVADLERKAKKVTFKKLEEKIRKLRSEL